MNGEFAFAPILLQKPLHSTTINSGGLRLYFYNYLIKYPAELDIVIKQITEEVLKPYNVKENSTGEMFRVCSTWKHMANLELIQTLNKILKIK